MKGRKEMRVLNGIHDTNICTSDWATLRGDLAGGAVFFINDCNLLQ